MDCVTGTTVECLNKNGHAAHCVFFHLWVISTILSPQILTPQTLLTDPLSPLSGFCGVLPTLSPIHFSPPSWTLSFFLSPSPFVPFKTLGVCVTWPCWPSTAIVFCQRFSHVAYSSFCLKMLQTAFWANKKKRTCGWKNVKCFFVQGLCTYTLPFLNMNFYLCLHEWVRV